MKYYVIVLLSFFAPKLYAQTVNEIEKDYYYGNYEKAVTEAHALVKSEPENETGWYLLTLNALESGDLEEIKDSIRSIPQAIQNAPLIDVAKGQILLAEKKYDSAQMLFNEAMTHFKKKETFIPIAIARAHIEEQSGNADKAIELLNAVMKREKKNPEVFLLLGDAYRKKGNGSQAFAAYQQALDLDANNAAAHYKQGKIFVSQKNAEIYLKHFNKAVAADKSYAPAWYELYYHYYFTEPAKAMEYLNNYIAAKGRSLETDYMLTDLLYTSKKYQEAIQHANDLLAKDSASQSRLYKLIAYSNLELGKTDAAFSNMQTYFNRVPDTAYSVKDFETMADIYTKLEQPDSAKEFYAKAAQLETDTAKRISYFQKLADIAKTSKNYADQAKWFSSQYLLDSNVSNLVLFNWGVAEFMQQRFSAADSVFSIYTAKYPDQHFGYYWRARSNAAIDTAMERGLAVPHYTKVIEMVEKDTLNDVNKKRLIESYGYLAAYKANTEKDFASAISYFEKLLAIQPENADAKKYIEILKKSAAAKQDAAPGN